MFLLGSKECQKTLTVTDSAQIQIVAKLLDKDPLMFNRLENMSIKIVRCHELDSSDEEEEAFVDEMGIRRLLNDIVAVSFSSQICHFKTAIFNFIVSLFLFQVVCELVIRSPYLKKVEWQVAGLEFVVGEGIALHPLITDFVHLVSPDIMIANKKIGLIVI